MIKKAGFIVFFSLVCFIAQVSAQHKILLMNGSVIEGMITDTSTNYILYNEAGKESKKPKMVEKYRVFSISYPNTGEVILYEQDSLDEEELTVEEMRYYIMGEQDAKKGYKSPWAFAGGVATGYAGGYLVSLLSPIVPAVYVIIVGSQWIKIKKHTVTNPEYFTKQTYLMGYEKAARSRRVQSALLGGLVGLAAGVGTQAILNPDWFK